MRKIFLFCIPLVLCLFLFSCAGGASGSDGSTETGRLSFSSSRALGSGASVNSDLQSFTLKGRLGGDTEKILKTWPSYESLNGSVIELDVGTWTFTLEAEYPSGKRYVYSGSQTASIKANEDTTVSFVLSVKGFLPSQASVGDIILSNGYACESGEQSGISGASATGVVINAAGGSVLAMMKMPGDTYLIGGSGSTYGAERTQIENEGYRIPTQAELVFVVSAFSSLGITPPSSGYLATSNFSTGTNHSCFYLANYPDVSNSGYYMGAGDSFSLTLYSVAVKDF